MPAKRVVSLCPSITETIVAIGGLKSLAGVTRYCTRPSGMLWGLPRVGGTKSPDIARILDLKPDLVLANAEENRREDVEALREAGIEVDVTLTRTVAQVPEAVRHWGKLFDTGDQADVLAARIETELQALASEPPRGRFRYAYWIWKDPWMTISDDTYVADLIRLAGGENVYGNGDRTLSDDAPLRGARPRAAGAHLSERAVSLLRRRSMVPSPRSSSEAIRAGSSWMATTTAGTDSERSRGYERLEAL